MAHRHCQLTAVTEATSALMLCVPAAAASNVCVQTNAVAAELSSSAIHRPISTRKHDADVNVG